MFEYKTITYYGDDADKTLNELGRGGWQLHSVFLLGAGPQFAAVLMRYHEPKDEAEDEQPMAMRG